jgi:hypothetical protein
MPAANVSVHGAERAGPWAQRKRGFFCTAAVRNGSFAGPVRRGVVRSAPVYGHGLINPSRLGVGRSGGFSAPLSTGMIAIAGESMARPPGSAVFPCTGGSNAGTPARCIMHFPPVGANHGNQQAALPRNTAWPTGRFKGWSKNRQGQAAEPGPSGQIVSDESLCRTYVMSNHYSKTLSFSYDGIQKDP